MDEWITKQQAAELLEVSERAIERRVADGFILKRYGDKLPGMKQGPVLFSRADVLALRDGDPNTHAVPVQEPANGHQPTTKELAKTLATRDPGANAWRDVAMFMCTRALTEPKPWLTLQEAAEYSGLPLRWLRDRARDHSIDVINVGSGSRDVWRFSREGLSKVTR
jgi:hypothetical protein